MKSKLFRVWRPGDILLLDGAMGTVLQQRGLAPGQQPELLNLSHPDWLLDIHKDYVAAGSQVIYTNTFGANALKLSRTGKSVEEIVSAAVSIAKEAAQATDRSVCVALDIGPLGELLEPLGTLSFERAIELFREIAQAGARAGADLAVIETMASLYETKAALLAVKESTDLPVFVTMSFDGTGRTFTGCSVASMAHTLEGLGADAIGLNCSLGPEQLRPLLAELAANTRLPVIAKPNAGLPDPVDGHYDMGPEEFARALLPCLKSGVTIVGGCCGTSPAYIRKLREALTPQPLTRQTLEERTPQPLTRQPPLKGGPKDTEAQAKPPLARGGRGGGFVCTPVTPCYLDGVRVIGERINPTGKKRFQQALLENDLDYILDVAVQEEDAGAEILDVNVGFPGVDEVSMLPRVVKKLQSAVSLPLQLDSSNPAALEAGLRVYDGKAAVNSVNGEPDVLAKILPIVKKYGASVVGLTLDKSGIPQTAEGRIAIAKRILDAALSYGIPKEDVWIDCLTLTVSAQQEQAAETLKAVRYVSREMGLRTVLGVSNISFGLPNRALITRTFLAQALEAGLTLPIINPNQREMMDTVAAFRVLSGEDRQCGAYLDRFAGYDEQRKSAPVSIPAAGQAAKKAVQAAGQKSGQTAGQKTGSPAQTDLTLQEAILRGLKSEAGKLAKQALETEDALALVQNHLIPALDRAGDGYGKGTLYLPQLLSAAQAAQSVFEVIRAAIAEKGGTPIKKGALAVATVQGDIHDIGKNIVKTVLENYGYQVLDLGRDVPPEAVVQAVQEREIRLVGLSALMTTTLPAMEETIRQLKALANPPVVFVGGAVVTPEYAQRMGADYYAKDAKVSVEIAKKVLG